MTSLNPSDVPVALRAAYEAARYEVHVDNGVFVLRHGSAHPEFDALLRSRFPTAASWTFVTAWNPYSKALTDTENHTRQKELHAWVTSQGLSWLQGVGCDDHSDWREESLVIVDLGRDRSRAVGARFGQYAVLVGEVGGIAEVCACGDSKG